MKKVIKWFFTAVIVAVVMRPGLEAAPAKDSATKIHSSSGAIDSEKAKTLFSPATHIDELKKPGYEVHIHDYSTTTTETPPHKESFIELLKYLEKTFHFIQVVDKNNLLATDLVDESWHEWFKYIRYVMPFLERISAGDIENPADDAPDSVWDDFLYSLMKKIRVNKVDTTDVDGDGEGENDIKVQYTTIKFDPIGQMANQLWTFIRDYAGVGHLDRWFKRVIKDIGHFSVFTPETHEPDEEGSSEEEGEEKIDGAGFGIGGVILPEGVLHLSKYDPVVFGVNTILFIIYNSIFWGAYLPNSGINNLFADYPDIPPEGECLEGEECPLPAECLEGEECPPLEECPEGEECPVGEGDGAEEEQEEGEAAEGEGGEGEGTGGDAAPQDGVAADDGGGPPPPPSDLVPPGGGAVNGGPPPPAEGLLPPPPPGGAFDAAYDLGATAIGGGGNRNDYYYYYDYDYVDQIDRKGEDAKDQGDRKGEDIKARSHDAETSKYSLSSNYYSHGAVPSHEAYTLQDTNIFINK